MMTVTLNSNLEMQVQSMAQQTKASVDELVNDILTKYLGGNVKSADLTEAYQAMAADTEREKAAEEWCNALIGFFGVCYD